MSLKDSALAVLQRNHERNQPATSEEKTMQLDTHLEGGKVAHDKLMTCIKRACKGLSITPDQFIQILNNKGKQQIISGEISASTLKDYAKQIDDSIQDGVVNLIAETAYQEAKL